MAKKPKYPTVYTSESKKDDVKEMSPKKFLKKARKLNVGKGDRAVIDNFKEQIEEGKPLSPLKLLKHNKEDGRHRATAAKELGIDEVPVIDERTAKALGGALGSDDPNRFMQDIMKFSFQVLPLLRPGYLKEVPKQGFAHGGHVLEDDYPTHYLPGVGRQVMADGGVPGQRFAAVDPSMLVGVSPQPFRGGEAYTDVGGQKVAAPFVKSMAGGYPVYTPHEAPVEIKQTPLPAAKNPFEDWMQWTWLSKMMGRASGGAVEDAINRALEIVHKSLGGYVSESKKIENYGTQGYETDEDRLHKKMRDIQEGEDKYD